MQLYRKSLEGLNQSSVIKKHQNIAHHQKVSKGLQPATKVWLIYEVGSCS
jgi:hypothetical protein